MTQRKTLFGASTALLTLFAVQPLAAQTIPACNDNAEAMELSDLTPRQRRNIPAQEIEAMLGEGLVCVRPDGRLRIRESGTEGVASAPDEAPEADAAPEAAASDEENPAATGGGSAGGDAALEMLTEELRGEGAGSGAQPAPEPEAETAGTPPEPEPEPEPEVETAETPSAPEPESETAEMPVSPADEPGTATATGQPSETASDDGPADMLENLTEELRGEDADSSGSSPDEEVAETGDTDGRNNDQPPRNVDAMRDNAPVETEQTELTEENTRSSDEDFEEVENRPANEEAVEEDDDSGLSAFEKFALGAAGIAVLSQVIDSDDEVVSNSGDRVVVQRDDGSYYVLKDEDALLRRPGSDVQTERFADGSTRTTVTRQNGVKVVTIAAADGTVLRRTKIMPDGQQVVLFDDTQGYEPVVVNELPERPAQERVEADNAAALRAALEAERMSGLNRTFSLSQVRNIRQVRELMPEINIDAINFATGSAAIRPEEAEDLLALGEAMSEFIAENPNELFLIEGHTDAVGSEATNLALSDRRAESVALALTEYFDVPPENMVVQGYGEEYLLVPTQDAERVNRRATVRRITPLLQVAAR